MSKTKIGSVESPKSIKAGCGIRYDPEQLGDDTGFDFSAAQELKDTPNDQAEPERVSARKSNADKK
jgi:hypothetical protein